MVFKRKFFLDLSEGDAEKPVEVAPVKPAPEKAAVAPAPEPPAAPAPELPAAPAAVDPTPTPSPSPADQSPVLTTAEAIAAELAAAQANLPAPSQATFAPEYVVAGGALPRRRRLAGANLGTFKEMAKGMMRS